MFCHISVIKDDLGPYEISFIFSQIQFYFFLNSVFSVLIFLDSFLMVKLNFINQKACLIN